MIRPSSTANSSRPDQYVRNGGGGIYIYIVNKPMSMTEQFNETVTIPIVRNVTSNPTGYLVLYQVSWPKLPVWFYAAHYDRLHLPDNCLCFLPHCIIGMENLIISDWWNQPGVYRNYYIRLCDMSTVFSKQYCFGRLVVNVRDADGRRIYFLFTGYIFSWS